MNSVNSIANSALQAFSSRHQVTANNIANVNTDGFKPSRASFQENKNGGVSSSVSGAQDTVDISREAVTLMSDSNGFKAGISVLKTADDMTRELLKIKA